MILGHWLHPNFNHVHETQPGPQWYFPGLLLYQALLPQRTLRVKLSALPLLVLGMASEQHTDLAMLQATRSAESFDILSSQH